MDYNLHFSNAVFHMTIDMRTFFPCTKGQLNKLLKVADYCNTDRNIIVCTVYKFCHDSWLSYVDALIKSFEQQYNDSCTSENWDREYQQICDRRIKQLERNKKKMKKFIDMLEDIKDGA